VIRFLFKCIFFLVLLFVIIAFWAPKPDNNNQDETAGSYSALDALMAMRNTVMDLGKFCERNQQTCDTGKSFISTLGLKARDGARITYEFLDTKFGNPPPASTPEPENSQPKATSPPQSGQPRGQKLSSKENHANKKQHAP